MSAQIRAYVILSTTIVQSGHPGGSLSAADIITTLYFHKLRHDSKNPKWKYRDRFVLSKGHCCPSVYAALALNGYFGIDELKFLRKFGKFNTDNPENNPEQQHLQGHPNALLTPGIEASTGSLGQGLSIAVGMALAEKLDRKEEDTQQYEIYTLLGDGECDEGQIWEAAMSAGHYKLDNLTAIVDRNRLQIDGNTEDVMSLNPIGEKFKAFGWDVIEIDGHNFKQIINAFNTLHTQNKPKAIIANTIKGKGVKFMENRAEWHGKACNFSQCIEALKDLNFVDENDEIYKNKDSEEYKNKEKQQEIYLNLFDKISE
ncbi:MAG: transketolase [Candidatus Altarchaeum sp. CG03_land_8_20_14_0_80_32_618]|nr:MAG: transketolase [Candidatus Altarchaeum sp. CG03_land_8_20_14_0_80_32_618]PIX48784.1 MAG: transketolase [Candidatus Altarchaeum sp. CG_4_8_14_3_um_filter_33_2054]